MEDHSIDGEHTKDDVYYINCPTGKQRPNAQFKCIEAKDSRKIIVIAIKQISKGKEIFASYGSVLHE